MLYEVRRIGASRPAGPGKLNGVTHNFVGNRHFADKTLEFDNLRPADGLLEFDLAQRGRLAHDLDFVFLIEVIDDDVEHEPVQLSFRQRVGTFQFDRVLRSQNVKGLLENVGVALDGNRSFLHCLQKCGLRLRRRPVDFVRKNDVRKNRALHENTYPLTRHAIFFDDFRSCDVGRHQVRSELDALEIQVQDLGDRGDQQRFCQAGNAGDDGVTSGQ